MKTVIQRVKHAKVEVEGKNVGEIQRGLLVFLGIAQNDTEKECDYMIEKLLHLRIFEDEENKMNKSVLDVNGDVMVVSQFTLYGDCKKGRRPSFIQAMPPQEAEKLYNIFVEKLQKAYQAAGAGGKIATGEFQAMMDVMLVNDGPVTIIINSL